MIHIRVDYPVHGRRVRDHDEVSHECVSKDPRVINHFGIFALFSLRN